MRLEVNQKYQSLPWRRKDNSAADFHIVAYFKYLLNKFTFHNILLETHKITQITIECSLYS